MAIRAPDGANKKRNVCQARKIVPRKDFKNSQFDNTPASGGLRRRGLCKNKNNHKGLSFGHMFIISHYVFALPQ